MPGAPLVRLQDIRKQFRGAAPRPPFVRGTPTFGHVGPSRRGLR